MKIHMLVAMLCCAGAVQAAEPARPAAPKPDTPTADKPAAAPTPARGREAQDRIELEATQVTGNRELPRVLYVVPWKRADLGDAGGRPANSLLDEVLSPVDRDVFRRQNRYYRALQPDGTTPAGNAPANDEK